MAVIALADPSIDGGGVGETRTLFVRWGVPARRTGACACVRALDPTRPIRIGAGCCLGLAVLKQAPVRRSRAALASRVVGWQCSRL